jgi:hypothetical protein
MTAAVLHASTIGGFEAFDFLSETGVLTQLTRSCGEPTHGRGNAGHNAYADMWVRLCLHAYLCAPV